MNLVLIGYRGSGKAVVGRVLADRLARPFVDTDALIEQQAGVSIQQIFARQGEQAFRDAETRIIREVASRGDQVIAVGGGAVLRDQNVEALRAGGWLAWLRASPEELCRRIQADRHSESLRPPLTDLEPLAEVRSELARRRAMYAAAADFVVDTDQRSPRQVAELILVAWSERGG